MTLAATQPAAIPARLIDDVCAKLQAGRRVRRNLPGWGRLHIDRQLPFLCLYRRPTRVPDEGTQRLIVGEASYLMASGHSRVRTSLTTLTSRLVETLAAEFGAFLLVEVWSERAEAPDGQDVQGALRSPAFRIVTHRARAPASTIDTLERRLRAVRIRKLSCEVSTQRTTRITPRDLAPLLTSAQCSRLNCFYVGLEVRPIYRDADSGDVFPIVRRLLLRSLSRALKHTFFEFARSQTSHRPPHFHSLGRNTMVKAVWAVDGQLISVSNAFDFLLDVTPVDTTRAWHRFRRGRYERAPRFHYRPLAEDPSTLKRRLWNIRIEHLEDPTIGQLFREKRDELDVQLSMLSNRDSPAFLAGSLVLFGKVEERLLALATDILNRVSPRSREQPDGPALDAGDFARLAGDEIEYYRRSYPEMRSSVEIREDVSGLMVSRGNLLVSDTSRIPRGRAEALLQHEIGTHVLTYYNGQAQPFKQLYSGLSGYEELQEGLAVFSEYLVGGLSRPRLRLLAGRVVAAAHALDGATFVDTFRSISGEFGFDRKTAFTLVMRIFRSGGFTKDMVYLRGIVALLDYLKEGGSLEPLFVGKIGASHIPVVRELQLREVLNPPPLTPRYMESEDSRRRLDRAHAGIDVFDMLDRRPR